MLSNTKDEMVRYLTKREFVEKLLIDIRERATDGQIRSVKEVLRDYFGYSLSSDDDDTIMRSFKNKAQDKLKSFHEIMIEYRLNPKLPCKSYMEQAKKNLEELLVIEEPVEFFKIVDKKRDDLLDDADDTAPVFDFFKSGQKKIFEKALEQIVFVCSRRCRNENFNKSRMWHNCHCRHCNELRKRRNSDSIQRGRKTWTFRKIS